jgi:hypothetical protein
MQVGAKSRLKNFGFVEGGFMAAKQKGVKKKKVVRHTAETAILRAEAEKKEPLISKTPMSARPKEGNPGFGVLKAVAAIIAVLVVGSAILFNRAGGRESIRGDKPVGEVCEKTVECEKGSICFAYKGDRHRCMKACSKRNPCESGSTCVSAASSKRKGIRVTEVCVPDAAH